MIGDMMKKVQRSEVMDYQTYTEKRDGIQKEIFGIKGERRLHVGPFLTFLFENADTMRYQIHEMLRVEQIVKEKEILHEMETYNNLLGDDGQLACTLLVEIDDREKRATLLAELIELPKKIYVKLEDNSKIYAEYDSSQVGEERLSSVQYLKFHVGSQVPVFVGTDHPDYLYEVKLNDSQRKALSEDLIS